jgi:hypothetical protein
MSKRFAVLVFLAVVMADLVGCTNSDVQACDSPAQASAGPCSVGETHPNHHRG